MNRTGRTDDFALTVSAWLHEDAEHLAPDDLDAVLRRTRTERQRPAWSSPERWLPMDLTARANALSVPRAGRLLLVALLVIVLAALAILAAGALRRPVTPPFGPAKNGVLTFSMSGDIYALDSIDATPRLLIGGATADFGPTFWRDGTHLLFARGSCDPGGAPALMVANADGTNVKQLVELTECPAAYDASPDGSMLAFAGRFGGIGGIFVLKTDGSDVPHHLDLPAVNIGWPTWRPPDGHELLYFEWDANRLRVRGIRPDGSGGHLVIDLGPIAGGTLDQLDPSFSADGRLLVYAAAEPEGFRNHLVDLASGVDRKLSLGPGPGHELHGQLSPDGTRLLFHYADDRVEYIQEMLAPLDGSSPAIPIGPPWPIVDGSADLSQEFSPDGRSIVIEEGRDQVVRVIDATKGGLGRGMTWQTGDLPGWQRRAP